MKELGRISRCKVRDIWTNENDFSDWLFSPENIELLSDTLGLNTIITQTREDSVGGFRADIVGEETDTGRKVIIENQFETSNHDHLGKIITYAAGKDASIIIWIVEDARPEHASAIEWLNNNMTDRGFFLVQIEVIKIEDSLPAATFTIIQKPNEYIQMVKAETDNTRQFKLEYWNQFLNYVKQDRKFLKEYPGTESRRPTGDHWYTFRKGCRGDYHIDCKIYTRNGQLIAIGTDVWINDNKDLYRQFEKHKDEIHEALGYEMEWDFKEDKKATSIRIKRDVREGEPLESTFEWLKEKAVTLRAVFNRYC
ncbi:DUF4268 domain-containing protein [Methanomethylophilus alvi]|uniref:DUF4268 domain-containing protein n=1 Tax=Methanomethylophilus alvi TaxID=1291540 RepID=UPI0037DD9F2B